MSSDNLGINFDIGHFFCAGENPAKAFEKLFPWIGHVHIEDIAADRTHNHLIPGLGAIYFEAVFAVMKQLHYDGDISLELYPYTDTPSEAGRQGRVHLLPMLEYYNLL
jgi:sugar phosphate isomerase/epimerase